MRPPAVAGAAAPATAPSATTTQPTAGLGQTRPSPRRASPSAARIHPASGLPVIAQSSSRPTAAGRSSDTNSSKSSAAWKFL